MNISNEQLMAYVDGECSAEERATIEQAVATNPALARQVEQQRALRQQLTTAFDPILSEPVPDRLLALLQTPVAATATVTPLQPRTLRRLPSAPQWLALAASLVMGVLVGVYGLQRHSDGALFATTSSALTAQGALARALNTQLASQQTNADQEHTQVRLNLSFKDGDGHYCRTFVVTEQALAGLACHKDTSWQVQVLSTTSAQQRQQGDFRQAGSTLPSAILNAVDQQMHGEPLDAAAEQHARDSGWR